MTSTFTTDFQQEFEAERARWLRRRFLWYTGVTLAISCLGLLIGFGGAIVWTLVKRQSFASVAGMTPLGAVLISLTSLASMGMFVWAFLYVRRRLLGRDAILRIVYWLIVIGGALSILNGVIQLEVRTAVEGAKARAAQTAPPPAEAADAAPDQDPESDEAAEPAAPASNETNVSVSLGRGARFSGAGGPTPGALIGWGGYWSIFVSHLFACLFLPWTPRECIRPILPLLLLNALVTIIYMGSSWFAASLSIVASPLVGAPGAAICWWRHSRFRDRFHYNALRGRYTQMRQELTDARRIHEALFPKSILDGPVRFDFRYQPMRQIGGDFLYTHRFLGIEDPDSEPLSIVIIDVTGHGIPAALTVNRLHGELERLFAEDPDITPGDVLTALNRYVHLTLATHSVYATALCLRVEPGVNLLHWASGGHPPAFLRSVDGHIDRLDSTAFVLGACHGGDFRPNQQRLRFGPGDTLIAYTDGATEARDQRGQMLRVEGLQRVIASLDPRAISSGGCATAVLQDVDRHRFGPPADDTLVVEVWRPLNSSK